MTVTVVQAVERPQEKPLEPDTTEAAESQMDSGMYIYYLNLWGWYNL